MWFCAGQARAEFALFPWLRTARGASYRQSILWFDFHTYTMHGCQRTRWSIVTIAQSSPRRIITLEKRADRCFQNCHRFPNLHIGLTPNGPRRMKVLTNRTRACSCGLYRSGPALLEHNQQEGEIMKNIKFVVRVSRGAGRVPAYVQRVDPTPIHMTSNRKLALLMGKLTAEDAVKCLQASHCIPELVPVPVAA